MTTNELKSIKIKVFVGKNNEEKTITLMNLYEMFLKHAEMERAKHLLGDL